MNPFPFGGASSATDRREGRVWVGFQPNTVEFAGICATGLTLQRWISKTAVLGPERFWATIAPSAIDPEHPPYAPSGVQTEAESRLEMRRNRFSPAISNPCKKYSYPAKESQRGLHQFPYHRSKTGPRQTPLALCFYRSASCHGFGGSIRRSPREDGATSIYPGTGTCRRQPIANSIDSRHYAR
jgi:hypothetical protein